MMWPFSRNAKPEPPPARPKFRPQPDITAWELAKLMGLLAPSPIARRFTTAEQWDAKIAELPPECRRHIEYEERP